MYMYTQTCTHKAKMCNVMNWCSLVAKKKSYTGMSPAPLHLVARFTVHHWSYVETQIQYCPLLLTPSAICCNLLIIRYIFVSCLHREDYGKRCCKEDVYFTTGFVISAMFFEIWVHMLDMSMWERLSSTLFKNWKSDRKSLCHLSQKLSNTVDFVTTESRSTLIVWDVQRLPVPRRMSGKRKIRQRNWKLPHNKTSPCFYHLPAHLSVARTTLCTSPKQLSTTIGVWPSFFSFEHSQAHWICFIFL